ncbi:hypothetical protein EV191_1325 [Tamaricihabitans halophyticus]|uniref:Uncharacterized protein n=1 Tax=Tamaricihabitans halophyticus TaxID=1262583 RepID=A0A4R2PY29_9PSEU|nr:hypothetical protein EV191_1325 [Tamaricihabitans halophyticus]
MRIGSVLNRAVESKLTDDLFALGIARWSAPAWSTWRAPSRGCARRCGAAACWDTSGSSPSTACSATPSSPPRPRSRPAPFSIAGFCCASAPRRGTRPSCASSSRPTSPCAQAIEDLRAEQLFDDRRAHFTVLAVQCRAAEAAAPPQQVVFEAAIEDGVRTVTDDVALMVANLARGWILLIQRQPPTRALVDAVAERSTSRFQWLTDRHSHPVFRPRPHGRQARRRVQLASGGVSGGVGRGAVARSRNRGTVGRAGALQAAAATADERPAQHRAGAGVAGDRASGHITYCSTR